MRSTRVALASILLALAGLARGPAADAQAAPPIPATAPTPAPRLERPLAALLLPDRLRQGDPLLTWALSSFDLTGSEARLETAGEGGGKVVAAAAGFGGPSLSALPLVGPEPPFRAYGYVLAIPTTLPPGEYRLAVATIGGPELSARVAVEARGFPSEDIPLDQANTKLRTEQDERKEAEARKLYEILGRADAGAVYLDGSAFMMPIVPRRKSAGFGDRRRYLYQGGGTDSTMHNGLDLAVATGKEVWACGPGRVVLATSRVVTGLTVVVEHLPGVYSLYMHMSSIAVGEGQVVERGALLGLSGSTGLSTGPHLHWELRAAGQAVDPEYWLSRPPLDKDRAAAIIASLTEGR